MAGFSGAVDTRRKFSAEETIRIVVAGLRGEASIAELCISRSDPEAEEIRRCSELLGRGLALHQIGLAAERLLTTGARQARELKAMPEIAQKLSRHGPEPFVDQPCADRHTAQLHKRGSERSFIGASSRLR